MSWLSFAARKWFSAALTIARRCDGRAWNVRHTKFQSPISTLQPKLNPATCHFSCVQIEIDLCSARNTGGLREKEKGHSPTISSASSCSACEGLAVSQRVLYLRARD